jgi:drug/metabolite transporter (DMT)-like permease
VAVTVGVLFLDEEFSLRLLAGGLLTILGIAGLNLGRPAPVVPGPVDLDADRGVRETPLDPS